MSATVFDVLGVDPDDLQWYDLGACRGLDTNIFFDDYEEDRIKMANGETVAYTAQAADAACLSCPVMLYCYRTGVDQKETGVWGGVYLDKGELYPKYNSHKTEEFWTQWRAKVRGGLH
jgi:hypothetical protein